MKKILFIIICIIPFLFNKSEMVVKATDFSNVYNFYIYKEQGIIVYEDYSSYNFYKGIYEFGYIKNENQNNFIPFHQIRIKENNKNKVLTHSEDYYPDWYYEINPESCTTYVNIFVLFQNDFPLQVVAGVFHDPDFAPDYWDITYYYRNGNNWAFYNEPFSQSFETYLLSCYDNPFFNSISPTSIYDINPDVGYGTSSIIDYSENIDFDFYLSNLNNNFPINNDGSCGYTAMSIILSYYDTFYNGDIIYNFNDMNLITKETISNYLQYNESPGANGNFKSLLVDVAGYLNIYDPNEQNPYGLTQQEISSILSYYMSWFCDYQYNYSVNQLYDLDDILSEVDLGYPVIICIKDYVLCRNVSINNDVVYRPWYNRLQNHAMVVYGYEINLNGDIFLRCHTGWKDFNLTNKLSDVIVIPLSDNPITGVSLRLVNNIHVHSNNYLYNGIGVCPCSLLLYNVDNEEVFEDIVEKLENDFIINKEILYYIDEEDLNEKDN